MATDQQLRNFSRLQTGVQPLAKIKKLPPLPQDVIKRFPTMKQWQDHMEAWRREANIAINGGPG